ncbi:MAG: serine/threonine-protein kinase [Pseudomonadota bacterium]
MAQRNINGTESTTASESGAATRMATRAGPGNRSSIPVSGGSTGEEAVSSEIPTRLAGSSSLPQHATNPPHRQSADDPGNASARTIEPGTGEHEATRQSQVIGVGSTLKDRFVLEEIIARGGMGVIYKARDLRKEEFKDRKPFVAVKLLGEECKTNPDFLIALQRETQKAQKLAHPNIVTAYDFDCDGDTVFMTMEYLVGQTLDEFIKKNQPYSRNNKTVFSIIEGMGQGLAYAHKNGIVHSDFKPRNVFLTRDGTVKILDFGISRAAKYPGSDTQDTTATAFDAGMFGALTPPYASCEMLEGDDPDPRDDIYALACVAYELLKGNHPFGRVKATVARDRGMKPVRIKGLDKHQWRGLLHGLAFEREIRTPDIDQFLHDIEDESRFLGLTRNWQMIAGLSFIFLVSGAFLLPYLTSPEPERGDDTNAGYESTDDGYATGPVHLPPEQHDKISRLLEVAEVHFMVGRITEPQGSNAYAAYKQILEINPQDQQARAGLVKIADLYAKRATESWEKGDIETSLAMIETGMNILPSHSGLASLKQEVSPDTGWLRKAISSIENLF